MNRLLQGDVGSGKTAVAFLAACAVRGGGSPERAHGADRAARGAARAHAAPAGRRADGDRGAAPARRCASACSPRPCRARAPPSCARAARAGELDLLIGTHALVQEDVGFARLALVVVDEQHRFGVLQRAALAGKGGGPAPAPARDDRDADPAHARADASTATSTSR